MRGLVQGIGVNDKIFPTRKDGKFLKEYGVWQDMLLRCTDKFQAKYPTYIGVYCSENFKSYSYFYEWCNKQVGFGNKDEKGNSWQLDKDLLIKHNKVYSEDNCIFIPQRINLLLTKRNTARGDFPIGTRWNKRDKRYVAQCSFGANIVRYLGYFKSVQEAFTAYKVFKEQFIKEVANEYKDQLDHRVYNALMKYEVNIND